ncbi:hypothetical protein Tco_0067229 [Tanacetum coccineum]
MKTKSAWFQEKYFGRTHGGIGCSSSQTDFPLTEKELHQLRMDKEALKEMLEEEAMNKKAQEEKIKQEQAENDAFFLEFGVVSVPHEEDHQYIIVILGLIVPLVIVAIGVEVFWKKVAFAGTDISKTVKNEQARTRESEEYKAEARKAKSPIKAQNPSPFPFSLTTRASLAITETSL